MVPVYSFCFPVLFPQIFLWFVSLLTRPVSTISWTHLLLFFTRTHVPELFCSALTRAFCVSNGNALILHQAVWLLERRKTAFCYLKDFCLKNRCSELPCLASALCSVPWTPQKLWGGATQVGFEFGSCHLTDNLQHFKIEASVFYWVLGAFLLLEVLERFKLSFPVLYPRCFPCSFRKSFCGTI